MKDNSRLKISCFIITKNEEKKINEVINSVRSLVEEIIIIDSGSTDQTVNIAKKMGAKVFFNDWKGFGEQKQFGENMCRNNWVLNCTAKACLSAFGNVDCKTK